MMPVSSFRAFSAAASAELLELVLDPPPAGDACSVLAADVEDAARLPNVALVLVVLLACCVAFAVKLLTCSSNVLFSVFSLLI